jgi:hypothetical protein
LGQFFYIKQGKAHTKIPFTKRMLLSFILSLLLTLTRMANAARFKEDEEVPYHNESSSSVLPTITDTHDWFYYKFLYMRELIGLPEVRRLYLTRKFLFY